MSVPNQKTVKVQKEKCDSQHPYTLTNLNAYQRAANDLKGEHFKLWCYLNKNQNGYTFDLSPVDTFAWGIGSRSTYNRAVAELKEKGYLVETSPNHFTFYELPPTETITVTINNSNNKEFEF